MSLLPRAEAVLAQKKTVHSVVASKMFAGKDHGAAVGHLVFMPSRVLTQKVELLLLLSVLFDANQTLSVLCHFWYLGL